jgi:uncharacterized protein (TIGR02246 family)
MQRYRSGWIVAVVLCACFGCERAPVDTRPQDEQAIRAADAAQLKAAQAKSLDGVVAAYSEDASWLPPNAPMVSGKAAVRASWARFLAAPGFNIDWQIDKLEVGRSSDIAYLIVTYQLSMDGPDGKPASDNGKSIEIWKKQADGTWKLAADTFNSDLPIVTTPPPAPKHAAAKKPVAKKRSKRRRSG